MRLAFWRHEDIVISETTAAQLAHAQIVAERTAHAIAASEDAVAQAAVARDKSVDATLELLKAQHRSAQRYKENHVARDILLSLAKPVVKDTDQA